MTRTTQKCLLDHYDQLKAKLGIDWPTRSQWISDPDTPGEQTIRYHFGSWAEFFILCGRDDKGSKKSIVPVTRNQTSVYLTNETIEMIGNREASTVINQTLMRVGAARCLVCVSDRDRISAEKHKRKPTNKYPDQAGVLNSFAAETNRDLSEAIVALDKVERDEAEPND